MAAEGRLIAAAGLLLASCASDLPIHACQDPVVFNEVMAAGDEDWIEVYNASDEARDLEGFQLATTQWAIEWTFPAMLIEAFGFVQVWADPYVVEGRLSTGFDLNRDGDALYLRAPREDGSKICDDVAYPDQHQDVAYARFPDGGEWCHAAEPTGGDTNSECF